MSVMEKWMSVEMPDGSKWAVPVSVIANNRADYYAKNDEDFKGDFERSLNEDTLPLFEDEYEIHDWAANNMNWEDVSDQAIELDVEDEVDYQEGWVNGEKEIIDDPHKEADDGS